MCSSYVISLDIFLSAICVAGIVAVPEAVPAKASEANPGK